MVSDVPRLICHSRINGLYRRARSSRARACRLPLVPRHATHRWSAALLVLSIGCGESSQPMDPESPNGPGIPGGPEVTSVGPMAWTARDGRALLSAWMAESGVAWAVGPPGAVVQWTGSSWLTHEIATTYWLNTVWGTGPDNVYAAGFQGLLLHYDGAEWRFESSGVTETISGMWGDSPDRLFAVGENGTALRFDGTSWQPLPAGSTADLRAIWGVDTGEVIVGAEDGTIWEFDGSAWDSLTQLGGAVRSLWAAAANDVWAIAGAGIWRYDGAAWSTPTADQVTTCGAAVRGRKATVVIAACDGIFEYDGQSWSQSPWIPGTAPTAVALDQTDRGVVVGDEGVTFHRDGSEWLRDYPSSDAFVTFMAISGRSPTDLLLAGWTGVWSFDGRQWEMNPTSVSARAVWAAPETDRAFAAAATDDIVLFDHSGEMRRWTRPGIVEALWGTSESDVYALQRQLPSLERTLIHYNGQIWSNISLAGTIPLGLAAFSSSDIALAGYQSGQTPVLARFNGQAWSLDNPAPPVVVSHLWGTSWDNLFASGGRSILHFDGQGWQEQASGLPVELAGLIGLNDVDVFAFGPAISSVNNQLDAVGFLFRYDGSSWHEEVRFQGGFSGAWADPASGTVILVGQLDGRHWFEHFLVHGRPQ